MNHHELRVFPTDDALATAAAAEWLAVVAAAARAGSRHLVALSGGRVAAKWFAAVVAQAGHAPGGAGLLPAGQAPAAAIRPAALAAVDFFWADERCVPPADPESNFRGAREGLFGPLGIAESRIHRIPGEAGPESAAVAATAELRSVANPPAAAMPVLDLVLLGMGEDGHVASLFPGDEDAAADLTAVFRPVRNSPKPPPCRVTLGLGPLVAARAVWVLITGEGKAPALREALLPGGANPLGRLLQRRPTTRIFSTIAPG